MKGTIYLEPRNYYDSAIIDHNNIIYSLSKILNLIMESMSCDIFDAEDFYYYNIDSLTLKGLAVLDDCK